MFIRSFARKNLIFKQGKWPQVQWSNLWGTHRARPMFILSSSPLAKIIQKSQKNQKNQKNYSHYFNKYATLSVGNKKTQLLHTFQAHI